TARSPGRVPRPGRASGPPPPYGPAGPARGPGSAAPATIAGCTQRLLEVLQGTVEVGRHPRQAARHPALFVAGLAAHPLLPVAPRRGRVAGQFPSSGTHEVRPGAGGV